VGPVNSSVRLRKLSTSIDLRNTSKFYHSVAPIHWLTENKTSTFLGALARQNLFKIKLKLKASSA
jgi:hypothetical protein